jgi:RNA polymerase sigma-70 factor (ECF subfamily)
MADRAQETLWVLRAQVGARDALEALFRAVQEPLYRYILGLVGDAALAEDFLQEVFLRIYRKLRWLREPELFRPWCYRITTREVFRRLKRERRWSQQLRTQAALEGLAAPPPEAMPTEPGLLARLPELLGRVSPASRAVLALHYLNELSLEEVADVLGIALGTAKSRLAYGLATLRRLLGEGRDP